METYVFYPCLDSFTLKDGSFCDCFAVCEDTVEDAMRKAANLLGYASIHGGDNEISEIVENAVVVFKRYSFEGGKTRINDYPF